MQHLSAPTDDAILAKHARRNFIALVADNGLFTLGWTFASASTILPAFVERLGAGNLLIGAIPAVISLGYALPQLFAAHHAERMERKLLFIMRWTAFERVPLLLLAITAFAFGERLPALAIAAVLLSLLALEITGGVLTPAGMDLVGKVVAPRRRGRLLGSASIMGSGLGLVGAVLSGYYLRTYAFPDGYALCFLTGFACLLVSWLSLGLLVEPPLAVTKPHVRTLLYLRRLPGVLRRDRSYAWYLVHRSIAQLGGMAGAFYAVHALRTLGAPPATVAGFTASLLAGQAVANMAFGWLGDRSGHRLVLLAGSVLCAVGNVLAFLARDAGLVVVVFACVGASAAAANVSGFTLCMEFAPDEERPTYVGLAATLTAPLGVAASLIGAALADVSSYRTVFALAAAFSLLALAVLALKVRDPRHRRDDATHAATPGE